jgi:hypothetical protein
LPARFGFDPAREAEWRDLAAAVRRAVDTELTPRQREVFVAIVVNGVPSWWLRANRRRSGTPASRRTCTHAARAERISKGC